MNLKVSLFNKSIFKTDIKRFWIASLIYTVVLFFLVPFQYVARGYYNTSYEIPNEFLQSIFYLNTYPAIFIGILCGGVFALMIFMYINSTSANSFYHALPCRRTTLYFSKLTAGVLLIIVPVVANLLILIGAKASGTFIPAHYNHLFKWAYLQLAYTLIMFFGVAFVAMFTGNFMYLIAIAGICLLTPMVIIAFVEGLFSETLYGYMGDFEKYLNWVYLLPNKMLTPWAFIYLALAVVFIILGCVIYNKRNLENNGEAVVFKGAKVFFLYLVAVLCGIFSYWYFSSLIKNSILWMLPFGIVGIIGANMINKKQVTLKGVIKPTLIYTVGVVVLLGAFETDITGFERRIPKVENVAEVNVVVPVIESNFTTHNAYGYRDYYNNSIEEKVITDAENIKKVIELHKYKIENREKPVKDYGYYVNIEYKLKNGRTLKRAYTVYRDADKNLAEDVFMLEEMKEKRFHDYKNKDLKYLHFTITHDFVPSGVLVSFMAGSQEFAELKEALNKDIEELTFEEDTTLMTSGYGDNEMKVSVWFEPDITENEKAEKQDYNTPAVEYKYIMSDGFKRTKAFLEEYGLYEKIAKAEDVESLVIRHYGMSVKEAMVEDRETIEKLYNLALEYDRKYNLTATEFVNAEFCLQSDYKVEIAIPMVLAEEIIGKYIE